MSLSPWTRFRKRNTGAQREGVLHETSAWWKNHQSILFYFFSLNVFLFSLALHTFTQLWVLGLQSGSHNDRHCAAGTECMSASVRWPTVFVYHFVAFKSLSEVLFMNAGMHELTRTPWRLLIWYLLEFLGFWTQWTQKRRQTFVTWRSCQERVWVRRFTNQRVQKSPVWKMFCFITFSLKFASVLLDEGQRD